MPGPTLLVNNLVQIRVWSTLAEQAAVSTFHFKVGVPTGIVDLGDAALSFDSLFNAKFKNSMSSQATYNGVQAYLLNTLPLPRPQVATGNAGPCAAGPVAQSRQTAGITTWLTAFAGPGNRGRTYWPFPPSSGDETIGEPNDAYLAVINDLCGDLQGTYLVTGAGGSAPMFHVLRVKRSPTAPIAIDDFETHRKWATQKRRGSYGRSNVSPI